MNGGHEAPSTFSAGHGTFLPKGLSIDGNGILQGNDPRALCPVCGGNKLPLCVRQLDVERCKDVCGKTTATAPDNIARALGNGAGAPKAHMGPGGAILLVGGLGLAAGGAVMAVNAMKDLNAASNCVTAAEVAAAAPGYMTTSGLKRHAPSIRPAAGASAWRCAWI